MRLGVGVALLLSLACGPSVGAPPVESDDDPMPGSNSTTTPSPSSIGSSMTDADESGDGTAYEDDGGGTGCSFTCPPPPPGGPGGGGFPFECSLYLQDCLRGEKCMPWANDGGPMLNATRCSPLADPAEAPGEACAFEGSGIAGIDSCETGAICVPDDLDAGGRPGEGVCAALCSTGCPDPADSCVTVFDGVLPLCTHACDPLAADGCDPGWTCSARELPPAPPTFVCQPRMTPVSSAAYEPCQWPTDCASGTFCGPTPSLEYDVCRPFCTVGPYKFACDDGYECAPLDVAGTQWDGLGACSD